MSEQPLDGHEQYDVCTVCHPDRRGEHGDHCCCPRRGDGVFSPSPPHAVPAPAVVEWRQQLRREAYEQR